MTSYLYLLLNWKSPKLACEVQNLGLNQKAFVDDKFNISKMIYSFQTDRVENILGTGENAGYQHFVLFSQCFQKISYTWSLKFVIMW